MYRLTLTLSAIALTCSLTGCGDDEANNAPNNPRTGSSGRADDTESSRPTNEPHSDDPSVLSGAYCVTGSMQITLANPARFPDKDPHATVPLEGQVGADVAKLRRALEAAVWHFSADGSVSVTWTDPFVQRQIVMTGSWNVLFDKFDVQVKNPNIMNQTSDGTPNAPLVLRGAMTKPNDGRNLSMTQAQLFYVPPDRQRITGQCAFELKPTQD